MKFSLVFRKSVIDKNMNVLILHLENIYLIFVLLLLNFIIKRSKIKCTTDFSSLEEKTGIHDN